MLTSKENTNFFGKLFGNASENASENAVWGAAGAPQRGEAGRETVRTWKRHCEMWEDLGQFGRRAAGTALN